MSDIITLVMPSQERLHEQMLSNYPRIASSMKRNAFPQLKNIEFYGNNSDRNSALLVYERGEQLHFFHHKVRHALDAGFLEKIYTACLYDASGLTLAGMRVYYEDRGGVVVTTVARSNDLIPFLIVPAFLPTLAYRASVEPHDSQKVVNVAQQLLGCCVSNVPCSLLNVLNEDSRVTRKAQDDGIMNLVDDTRRALQKFAIEYTAD